MGKTKSARREVTVSVTLPDYLAMTKDWLSRTNRTCSQLAEIRMTNGDVLRYTNVVTAFICMALFADHLGILSVSLVWAVIALFDFHKNNKLN